MDESVGDHSIQIAIDRGGTFTDVHASWPATTTTTRHEWVTKLLSQDAGYEDAPREGIRRVLEHVLKQPIPRNQPLNTDKIDCIRLSTTVGTNALLERSGAKHALLITKGFRDLLEIGNQSRPRIFDLAIQKPSTLYAAVVEVDERVTLLGFTSDPRQPARQTLFAPDGSVARPYDGRPHPAHVVRGNSGEAVQIIRPLGMSPPLCDGHPSPDLCPRLSPDEELVRRQLGGDSPPICTTQPNLTELCPEHEQRIGRLAQELGFAHISLSSTLMPMIKLVTRGTSTTADAYLTPVLGRYIDGFFGGFDGSLQREPGGPLAVTDANLLLGRLVPGQFPKIFGPNEDQELDVEASRTLFEELRATINHDLQQDLSVDEPSGPARRALEDQLARLQAQVVDSLHKQGFEDRRIVVERFLNMRYDGTDTALMVLDPSSARPPNSGQGEPDYFDYLAAFKAAYRQQFGFILAPSVAVVCDDVRVRGSGKSSEAEGESVAAQLARIRFAPFALPPADEGGFAMVFFEQTMGRVRTPVLALEKFRPGDILDGPAVLLDQTQTVVVDPDASVRFLDAHVVIDLH
ncbi:hypothetical protein PtA15_7A434 [Puccinia triticina]|uniref:Hydantoinase/oxoprolinase N-terminal domain-containing protein n=1 Tax=Puccinia triticina TaxID=208348 RepID=A0ABY7CN95_9BASI|nr:uncharacterized protein PtA15_7A434 [Puccinia triticina]WAQ86706.1 hypothetical protein PtA15_7A434 [Puccinia triticina]